MTADLLKKIADTTGAEAFAVIKAFHEFEDSKMPRYVLADYMGELTIMASFYLYADAKRYADDLAVREPLWIVYVIAPDTDLVMRCEITAGVTR